MLPCASRSRPPRLPAAAPGRYAIALGSNRRHGRHGAPAKVLAAALTALAKQGLILETCSPVFHTPALGPGGRHYANMAALIATPLSPPELLRSLKRTEQDFGRRRGRRWGARVLDLDILIWSGGDWHDPRLHVPHRAMADRRFVLDPLVRIAPDWRVRGALTVRHLRHRLTRTAPVHRGSRTVGL